MSEIRFIYFGFAIFGLKQLKIKYICTFPEQLKINKKFDVVLNMEIIEHVEDIIWMVGADGGNIAVRTNSGSGLTFTVYGNEFKV